MRRSDPILDFIAFSLDQADPAPIYRQIYNAVIRAVVERRLKPGDRLPSSRGLARTLRVGRNTVGLAFEQLIAEGFVETRHGSGSFVSSSVPQDLASAVRHPTAVPAQAKKPRISRRAERYAFVPHSLKNPQPMVPFRLNMPALDAFPTRLWAELSRSLLSGCARGGGHLLGEVEAAGYRPLREMIARHVGETRGVVCEPDQVIVVAGALQGIDLAVRLLLDPEDAAWCEDPVFPGALAALRAGGARVVPVPVDDEGLVVEAGERLCPEARLAIVCPSAQFPLGVTLSLRRRLSLLEWAQRSDAWIIEDDYDSEYRYDSRPIASLQGVDGGQRVIYIGTFSKVLFPSLRLAYVIAPPGLTDLFVSARVVSGRHSPMLEQATVARFMEEGHLVRHIRRMRTLYMGRRAALAEAADRHLRGLLRIGAAASGLQVIGWLPPGWSDLEVSARAAAEEKLQVTPLSRFSVKCELPPGLILGFGAFDSAAIESGTERLGRLLTRLAQEGAVTAHQGASRPAGTYA